jgi:hypothetical protein
MNLPLWIEEKDFQVVHACWSPEHIKNLQPLLQSGNRLSMEALVEGSRRGTAAYGCIETLLKGVEVELPNGSSFTDKDGHERQEIRTRWWDQTVTSYRAAYIGPAGAAIPDVPMANASGLPEPDKPTFIGHYWLDPNGPIGPLSRRVACVDYSVARGGHLVADRFRGERDLSAAKFVSA